LFRPAHGSRANPSNGPVRLKGEQGAYRAEKNRRFRDAAAAIVFAAVFRRMAAEFGPRGVRLAYLEAGHAAQNVCLQATALGLSVIGLGRIDENLLRTALQLPEQHEPLYLLTIGRRWA
jgi:nitroreductase